MTRTSLLCLVNYNLNISSHSNKYMANQILTKVISHRRSSIIRHHPLKSPSNQSLARKTVKVNTSCLDYSIAIVGSTKGEDIYDKFSKPRVIEKG